MNWPKVKLSVQIRDPRRRSVFELGRRCNFDEKHALQVARLALDLDLAVRENAPAGWKSDIDGPRGKQVSNALYPLLSRDSKATKAMFEIIKNQPGY